MKVFEGQEYPTLPSCCERLFDEAKGYKPRASRSESVEMFIVCHGYRGPRPEPKPVDDGFLPKRALRRLEDRGVSRRRLSRTRRRRWHGYCLLPSLSPGREFLR